MLVLEHVGQLVRERRLPLDVQGPGAADHHLLRVRVVVRHHAGLVHRVERLHEVGLVVDQTQGAQLTAEILDPVLGRG